ncbi:ecdysone receptor-like [Hylaeus volcanicus]|uniref:ecdysone receptor-like n=1 Tax=Hylaeus volcanicus TaxID=313075 RepID=UPI0023B7787C|nr:ecdysone receptor-like [Hylaeus volcanicus]
MDTSDSSMDTANGGSAAGVASGAGGTIASVVAGAASLTLVKAETPEHLAGTSTTPSSVTGPVTAATGLFAAIASGNKPSRPDDWLSTNSPGSPSATLQNQHVVYTTPQQQLSESQQQQPPLAHSSPLAHQQPVTNNGYASPMSTSSYDPYSPNSKIGE